MIQVLFICLGNICRSPMAEYYFRNLVQQEGLSKQIITLSAAVSDEEEGNPVYPPARQMLAKHGISCQGKQSQVVTQRMIDDSDYVICMDSSNIQMLKRMLHVADDKLSRLLDYVPRNNAAYHGRDVKDPWYTRNFEVAWADITVGCAALLDHIRAEQGI